MRKAAIRVGVSGFKTATVENFKEKSTKPLHSAQQSKFLTRNSSFGPTLDSKINFNIPHADLPKDALKFPITLPKHEELISESERNETTNGVEKEGKENISNGIENEQVIVDLYCHLEKIFDSIVGQINDFFPEELKKSIKLEKNEMDQIPERPKSTRAVLIYYCSSDRWLEEIDNTFLQSLKGAYEFLCLVLLKPIDNPSKLSRLFDRQYFIDIKQLCYSVKEGILNISHNRDSVVSLFHNLLTGPSD